MRGNMKGKEILVSVLAVLLVIIFSHPAAMAAGWEKIITNKTAKTETKISFPFMLPLMLLSSL